MKKKLLTLLSIAASTVATYAQTARVMAIHNSPDPAVDTVDVYIWANNAVFTKVENLGFRAATGFVDVPAGTDIRVAFAPKTSTTIADTLIGFGFNLAANQKYVLLAQGHVGSGFTPQQPFKLHVVAPAFESISSGGDSTTFAVVHGSTDAPNVDIALRNLNDELAVLENVPYDANSGYLTVATDNYFVDVIPSGASDALITYGVPLKALNAGDAALVVFASGVLNRAANNNAPAFGVYAALANGTVIPLPVQSTFRLQAMHNCADPAAANVDVWLLNRTTNVNQKLIPNFGFRKASPYIDAPANEDIAIGIALPNSTTVNDIIYTEEIGKVPGGIIGFAVASGILDTSKFEANPSGNDIGFVINIISGSEKPAAGKVGLQVFHGATDAPAVDVNARGVGTLFGNLAYGESGDGYLEVGPASYTIDIAAAGTQTVVASYTAPLTGFVDSSLVVVASGFLSPNLPAGRDAGAAFALVAVTPSGQTIVLPTLTTGLNKLTTAAAGFDLYPNPVKDELSISMNKAAKGSYVVTVSDLSGRMLVQETIENNLQSKATINTSTLSKGMYILNIVGGGSSASQKIIVE